MGWDFLLFILSKIGSGDRWIWSFKRCVSCARVSVLVNGLAGEEFKMERGLW